MRGFWCALVALVGLGVSVRAEAQARKFVIESGSQAQFVSDAPLERITGVSMKAQGFIELDPSHVESTRGEVRVPVASIRTNVELRDEHLRSDSWLDATRFPNATFVISNVQGAALGENQASDVKVQGKFSVHGVTHDVSTTAHVRYTPGSDASARDALRVQASFTVHLESYGVSIPSIVSLKVAKDIQVNVDLRASAEKPKPAPEPVAEAPAQPAPQAAQEPPKASEKAAEKPPAPRVSEKPAESHSEPKSARPSAAKPAKKPERSEEPRAQKPGADSQAEAHAGWPRPR
jgi:polyisoprenoid-binding protein YceI